MLVESNKQLNNYFTGDATARFFLPKYRPALGLRGRVLLLRRCNAYGEVSAVSC